uniref:Uncharacterized protein MANES_07G066300 n=1 Tax=Rhizophora mucronata TaxID=61149 RepID=A0A2P2LDI6_RHIMU
MPKTKEMGVSSSRVGCHNKSYSCPKQGNLEETHGLDAESKCAGQFKQLDSLRTDIRQPELGDSVANSGDGANKSLQPFVKDATRVILTEGVYPPPENACNSILTDRISSPKLNTQHNKPEFGSEGLQIELGPKSALGELLKENDLVGSQNTQSEASGASNAVLTSIAYGTLQSLPDNLAKNYVTEGPGIPNKNASYGNQVDKSSLPQHTICSSALDSTSDSAHSEQLEERKHTAIGLAHNGPVKMITASTDCIVGEHPERTTILCLPPVTAINIPSAEQLTPSHTEVENPCSLKMSETSPYKVSVVNSGCMGRGIKRTPKSSRRKYMLRSLVGSDRVLRSRLQVTPKALVACNNLAKINSSGEKKRRRKRKRGNRVASDEYLRIRRHLRYLLNRVNYEQSLIIAYSGEGWKGLSVEKLKPEKELQRATSEILRRKLKIRDLFHRIDSLRSEGRLPASLFDSEGQINSEDIFCAKCGSKDLTADNDIILCDGGCERGFHQFCLIPPLKKEDIPPDDEGWLCPGCDCKVDCIDLLNDSQRTKLSIIDSCEKVFPEAAGGRIPDENLGLPSDDSDDDYDPDGLEFDEKREKGESMSDESDFTSSDELGASPDDHDMGLPSDDSEDDDYDPDVPGHDDNVKEESSSSDFTSDSEDITAVLDNNELSGKDENPMPVGPPENPNVQSSKSGAKKEPIKSELLHRIELDPDQDGSALVSGRRNVERLDYKKLYDETYGNASSDSSEDEDYSDIARPRKRWRSAGKNAVVQAKGNEPVTMTSMSDNNLKQDTNVLPAKIHEHLSLSCCHGKKVRPSSYRRLGEDTTRRLCGSFKENQYPDRATKESLAKELGLAFQQVDRWFGNARWSFNHPSTPASDASAHKSILTRNLPEPKMKTRLPGIGWELSNRVDACNGAQGEESSKGGTVVAESNAGPDNKLENQEGSKQKSKILKPRGRKTNSNHQILEQESKHKVAENLPANLVNAQETQAGKRII